MGYKVDEKKKNRGRERLGVGASRGRPELERERGTRPDGMNIDRIQSKAWCKHLHCANPNRR